MTDVVTSQAASVASAPRSNKLRRTLIGEIKNVNRGKISIGVENRGKWSGLSESNRHLNLGKVPYYHYTKAA